MAAPKKVKKTKKKNIPQGIAHIHSTHNNTIVTVTDKTGNTIAWSSSGAIGYKGSKQSTPYAASLAAAAAADKAKEHGVKEVLVKLNGTGPGKDSARKQLEVSGITITGVLDVTATPFNGTRPPRKVFKRMRARR